MFPAKIMPNKDPSAILDYTIDWTVWLGTDTLATSSWTVASGITKGADTHTTVKSTVWLSGGTAGASYDAVCTVTTASGRTDQRTIRIPAADR